MRSVRLEDGTALAYDYLIVATGATHSYFGRDDWRPFAPGLKTLDDALEIRRRVLLAFERAERETSRDRRRAWLTFAVVGAGPTGVELAGTLAEVARHTLRHEFRRIDPGEAHVVLIEAGERVLPAYPVDVADDARRQLERLHVDVRTRARVCDIDADGVSLADGRIATRTTLWAAGVVASPLGGALDADRDRAGRIVVAHDLSLARHPEIFVAGDLAHVQANDAVVPANAPAAKQMGRCAAENVLRRAAGKPALAVVYRDHGSLATIGRAAAVAVRGRLSLSGRTAWLLWLCAHIYFLIGFRNKLLVMVEWCWAYVTFERHARIILRLQRD
jgi:NADH dehydrogenase